MLLEQEAAKEEGEGMANLCINVIKDKLEQFLFLKPL